MHRLRRVGAAVSLAPGSCAIPFTAGATITGLCHLCCSCCYWPAGTIPFTPDASNYFILTTRRATETTLRRLGAWCLEGPITHAHPRSPTLTPPPPNPCLNPPLPFPPHHLPPQSSLNQICYGFPFKATTTTTSYDPETSHTRQF